MTSIVEEDDAVVGVAYEVLEGEAAEGTKNLRRGTSEGGAEFVYRIDPDADGSVAGPGGGTRKEGRREP